MRQISVIFMVLCLTIVNYSKASDGVRFETKDNGSTITRTYDIDNFNEIYSTVVADVIFTQTTNGSSSLKITGPKLSVSRICVSVIEGVLRIENQYDDSGRSKRKNDVVKIYVSAPTIRRIENRGVGNININNSLKVSTLTLVSKGVGNISISNLTCGELFADLRGVGNIKLEGKATDATMSLRGVGDIKAYDLEVKNLTVDSRGVGNVECYATKSIYATSRGIGGVVYKGEPKDSEIVSKGMGSIRHKR